jgi:MYXO-CTERM domain-containing protein
MRRTQVLMAAILLAAPAPLLAQSGTDNDTTEQRADDQGNPRTGLLGLLGLLGLFGLMRREPNIHFDARRSAGRQPLRDAGDGDGDGDGRTIG